jgi:DNA-binding transcriptional MerR regulator
VFSASFHAENTLFFLRAKYFSGAVKKDVDSGTRSTVYNSLVIENGSSRTILRSAAFARLAGVSTDTLRHYERKKLLKPQRSRNGYREYTTEMLDRVRLIRRAISVGFTIDELSAILKARDKGDAPCHQVHTMAQAKLAEVETQLRELTTVRDDLRSVISDWDTRITNLDNNQRAGLLEALANTDAVALRNHSPISKPSRNQRIRSKYK